MSEIESQLRQQLQVLQQQLTNLKAKTCDAILVLTEDKTRAIMEKDTAHEILNRVATIMALENPDIDTVLTKLQELVTLPKIIEQLEAKIADLTADQVKVPAPIKPEEVCE